MTKTKGYDKASWKAATLYATLKIELKRKQKKSFNRGILNELLMQLLEAISWLLTKVPVMSIGHLHMSCWHKNPTRP